MIDFIGTVRRETNLLIEAARRAPLDAPVPSCPDWKLADLLWHITEVQHFWATVVRERLQDPGEYDEPSRPGDDELLPALAEASDALVDALVSTPPETACWTWSDDQSAGFIRRKQAHEALMHRVDAEQTAGAAVTPVDAAIAADGVDEIITVMLSGVPEWGHFAPDGVTVRVVATDAGREWDLSFGRMTGTSPNTGKTYDLDASQLGPVEGAPDAVVSGPAQTLDLWLWGRAGREALTVNGDAGVADRLRALAAETTQ